MSPPETRIQELNLTLPGMPKPLAKYRPAVRHGDLLYVSGHLPMLPEGGFLKGKVGTDVKPEQGFAAARQAALAVLSTVRSELVSLNNVKRLLKTMGLVNCTPDFVDHPKVINGFSEVMAEVFGDENGVGVRSAFGASSLPGNATVEVECIFVVG